MWDSDLNVYIDFLNGRINKLPYIYHTKENYLKYIGYLYKTKRITKDNVDSIVLREYGLIYANGTVISVHEVYSHLFGDQYYMYPWRYKKFKFLKEVNLTIDMANQIFNNYLKEFKIKIPDIFNFSYSEHMRKSHLTKFEHDLLYFVVQYYKFKYPGYKFKIASKNYYKEKENRIFDLKYLIEHDMKLPTEKIPLYLTIMSLQIGGSKTLYHVLKKYYRNLYEWVNECYPNKFIESDFNINQYRTQFDSIDESKIHDVLCDKFENIIYNQRNSKAQIKIKGMIPDWFVFTDKGVWIIEYFGMYIQRQYGKSSRITDYIDKTNEKIEKYNEIINYSKLFFYPEDMNDNMSGIKEKIKSIV